MVVISALVDLALHYVTFSQVKEEDELGAKPKRRGKVMSDYEKWEISQLIKSGGCGRQSHESCLLQASAGSQ